MSTRPKDLHRSGPFRLNGISVAVCLLLGGFLGSCFYSCKVEKAFRKTEEAYAKARPIEHAFTKDPAFGIRDREQERMTPATLLRLLTNFRLVAADIQEAPEDLRAAHEITNGNGIQICAPGTGVLFLLSAQHGKLERVADVKAKDTNQKPANCDWTPTVHERAARQHLAMVMAGQPGALRRWQRCILEDGLRKEGLADECVNPQRHRPSRLAYLTPFRSAYWGAAASNDDLLRTLFEQTSTAQPYWVREGEKAAEEAASYSLLVGYSRRLLGEMQEDSDVKWETIWITIYMGPEQLAMMCVFCGLMLMLLCRWLARIEVITPRLLNVSETGHDEPSAQAVNDRSRWLVRWLLRSLPALGFIGTVRSLTLALSNADSIVRADGAMEQATAISNVSTTLAVAFTTTLVALILGLGAGLANDHQLVRERRAIRAFWKQK